MAKIVEPKSVYDSNYGPPPRQLFMVSPPSDVFQIEPTKTFHFSISSLSENSQNVQLSLDSLRFDFQGTQCQNSPRKHLSMSLKRNAAKEVIIVDKKNPTQLIKKEMFANMPNFLEGRLRIESAEIHESFCGYCYGDNENCRNCGGGGKTYSNSTFDKQDSYKQVVLDPADPEDNERNAQVQEWVKVFKEEHDKKAKEQREAMEKIVKDHETDWGQMNKKKKKNKCCVIL